MRKENPRQENPPAKIEDLAKEPEPASGPIDVQMNNEVELDPLESSPTLQEWLVLIISMPTHPSKY